MAFRASKIRERKRKTVAEGSQLIPSATITNEYTRKLNALMDEMERDYRKELLIAFKNPDVKEHYAEDASPTVLFKRVLSRLDRKWRGVYSEFAKRHVNWFTEKVDSHSSFTAKHSLSTLGLDKPKDASTESMVQAIQASIAENVNLITNIQEQFTKDIEGSVFRSIADPNPTKSGSDALMEDLVKRVGIEKRRAQFIAEDQNSKLYTALNKERMRQNGIDKFRWKHSSAGKTPRESHLQRQHEDIGLGPGIFYLDSPQLWEGPKNDQGPPGYAMRCRCRMIPVIDFGI